MRACASERTFACSSRACHVPGDVADVSYRSSSVPGRSWMWQGWTQLARVVCPGALDVNRKPYALSPQALLDCLLMWSGLAHSLCERPGGRLIAEEPAQVSMPKLAPYGTREYSRAQVLQARRPFAAPRTRADGHAACMPPAQPCPSVRRRCRRRRSDSRPPALQREDRPTERKEKDRAWTPHSCTLSPKPFKAVQANTCVVRRRSGRGWLSPWRSVCNERRGGYQLSQFARGMP
jgi:hypothetical protein